MVVKGIALESTPKFILKKLGEDAHKKWINSLSENAKKVYSMPIFNHKWYSLKEYLLDPTMILCELFFNGDIEKVLDIGRFSAENSLKGIYKIFIKLGSPEFILKKASMVLSSYYQPSSIEVTELLKYKCTVRITKFEEMHRIIENRIIGWIEKALEISGAKNVKIQTTKSLTKKDEYTELIITWE